MKNKSNIFNIILVFGWILLFNWNHGFGLSISWWVYILTIVLWFLYVKFSKFCFVILFILLLNLHINHLFTINNRFFDFNLERFVLFKPEYIQLVSKYKYDDVFMPYRLRTMFYQNWLTIFFWIDSFLKILSPLFWSYVLGFSGLLVAIIGIFKVNFKYILWLLGVCLSSSLAILYDTKTAVFLALPALVCILSEGINSKFVKHYWWVIVVLIIIDLAQK